MPEFVTKEEILEHLARQQEVVNTMVRGQQMIIKGGVPALKLAVEQEPELLLAGLVGSISIVKMLQEELVEAYEVAFEISDAIDKAIADSEKQ